jgi:DNA-directed RNA polymerase subunit RPC12/RpoP
MITKYVGIFCAHCSRFILVDSYSVERPEQIGVELRMNAGDVITCPYCGEKCAYQQPDVAHSASPDGTEPQYPHKH